MIVKATVRERPESHIYECVYVGRVVSEDEMTLTLRVPTATVVLMKNEHLRVEPYDERAESV